MQFDNENIKQWAISIQASIDTAKFMLKLCVGSVGGLCAIIVTLVVYIFRSHKEYTAQRFIDADKRHDEHCKENQQDFIEVQKQISEHTHKKSRWK